MLKLAEQVIAAYDATDNHIGDSDLDDEQPISILVRATLGDLRRARREHCAIKRGEKLVAADLKAREDYDETL